MHYACKGIMGRLLFAPWFDPQHVTDSYSLLGISHELYNLFLCIKVPHDLTRKPYSIAKSKHWKASEFCLFALFAGMPCSLLKLKICTLEQGDSSAYGGETRSMPNLQGACFTGLQIHTQCC